MLILLSPKKSAKFLGRCNMNEERTQTILDTAEQIIEENMEAFLELAK